MNETAEFCLDGRLALRPKEAAAALGVSDRTLRTWMRNEGLPHFRLHGTVLIPTADLREWIVARIQSKRTTDDLVDEILRDL